jgi:hypothetical protein
MIKIHGKDFPIDEPLESSVLFDRLSRVLQLLAYGIQVVRQVFNAEVIRQLQWIQRIAQKSMQWVVDRIGASL